MIPSSPTSLVIVTLVLNLLVHTESNTKKTRDTTAQPRIITQDGHLIFQTGENYNITFKTTGRGRIRMDNDDFLDLANNIKSNNIEMQSLKSSVSTGNNNFETRFSELENRLNNLQLTGEVANKINELTTNFDTITQRVVSLENQAATAASSSPISEMRRKIRQLETSLNRLNLLLTNNECQSNPCRNGGTCVDVFNGFLCTCPPGWEGTMCDRDFNECGNYQGTDLGCQNQGNCINTPGSFTCQCTANWRGIRCTERHDDCTGASVFALCGHGTCVNEERVEPGRPKYKCICDIGWTTGPYSPACDVDVDECAGSSRPPCSVNPLVQCINLPGTFHCGACPNGYTGNGHVCSDIDECLINNGGCSLSPRVTCINQPGTKLCGPCPSGYQGNGLYCHYIGVCGQMNGGCHPLATCTENIAISQNYRLCICPPGYEGNGIGSSGCTLMSGQNPCSGNPCIHGTCQVSGNAFVCICNPGYTGTNCNTDIDECANNPCQNGGTCVDQVNGYQCTCTTSYTGTNCQTAQQRCGNALYGDRGSFQYPPEDVTHYPHQVNCAWRITVSAHMVVNIVFTKFRLESHYNCDYDFLQINDGPSATDHSIGKFCGTTLPRGGNITSNHNQLYFWFSSDRSVVDEGFTIVWTAVLPVCGGDLSGSSYGAINSPGYPGRYPHNRECVWVVSVPVRNKIQFAFGTLQMETHPNCSHDYLEIRDGILGTSTLIQRYCSSGSPAPVITSGPYAWLMFHSDQSVNANGFHITYTSLPVDPQCGGSLTSENAIIISPNYPNPYHKNAECFWTITVPINEKIILTFTNMDLELSIRRCTFDYVEVRDGEDETANSFGRFCGRDVPSPITSSSNKLWVKFQSDASEEGNGFRATYTVACGGEYTEPTGILRSPYHPNPYPRNIECIYLISQDPGILITLIFLEFEIEINTNCDYDFLEIRDGSNENSPLIGKYCGGNSPGTITSTNNALWLKFKSDGTVENLGFLANYTTLSFGCGGTFTENMGMFTTPGHPVDYPHNITCTWTINVSPGFVIRLSFNTFALESHANCLYDYLAVYDNATSGGGLIGKYCGNTFPPMMTSSENVMTVVFKSDHSVAGHGFTASYIGLNASTVCGGEVRDETGIITSPNYPQNYPHSRDCIWVISVSSSKQILLNFTDFVLEQHRSCNFDFVEIRNGGFANSPLVAKYCGTIGPPLIQSHSNRMYIHFKSDGSRSAKGFRLIYDGTASGCGADLSTPSGSFVSPNYPQPYSHSSECYWSIHISHGSLIQLTIVDLELESHRDCNYDYIEVHDGAYITDRMIGRYCGNQVPDPIQSIDNQLWVKFRADFSNAGRGFHAVYHSICNNRIKKHSGIIESPNFPNRYPHNRDCIWIIETNLGNRLNITFSHFNMEFHSTCRYDYLEIRDGENADAVSLGKWCGTNTRPLPLSSTQNMLWIHMVTDRSGAADGFRLEFITDGCGGVLKDLQGSFSSPNYPNAYPPSTVCEWKITVEPDHAIQLTIFNFDLESHTNCVFDVLEVFGGPDSTSPRLVQLCHLLTSPQRIASTGNSVFVRFQTDVSINGKGFWANYTSISGGCGGNFSTVAGNITSPNYPNQYSQNTDCSWTINSDANHVIEFTFLDFDVESHVNCSFDYVAVYDGPNENSPSLIKHCGNALPSPHSVKSSGNQMFIRMKSDGTVSAKGFKASYKRGCGAILNAAMDGEFHSSNFPGNYERNANCSWIVNTFAPGEVVTLFFVRMDLEESANCSSDYIRILDGNNEQAPEIDRFCGSTIPVAITSQSEALYIQFVSDMSYEGQGFSIRYTKSLSACGGDLAAYRGSFISPGYPNGYPLLIECIWTVSASPGNSIQLSFRFFDLQQDEFCNHDYVEVREKGSFGRVIGRYCGNTLPNNLTASNKLWVKFKSDASEPSLGFMADFELLHGGQLTGNIGQVSSPLYPRHYPRLIDHTWLITVNSDLLIRLRFDTFDLEDYQCRYDYLEIFDGNSQDAVSLGKYCGTTIPEPIYGSGNQIFLHFHSDSSAQGQGFLISWNAIQEVPPSPTPQATPSQGCGGELIAIYDEQNFTSPGYPQNYENNLNCVWIIRSLSGTLVWLNITDIDLEGHSACNYDKIVVSEGLYHRNELAVYCGHNVTNSPVTSMYANSLTVQFTTDSSVSLRGFAASFKSGCGGFIQESTGVIQSPRYPDNYPENLDCTWQIYINEGRSIHLTFEAFDIESSTDCNNDYILFYNGYSIWSPLLGNGTYNNNGRYCGPSHPVLSDTSGNWISILFVSDSGGNRPGFKITFNEVSVACGGHLTLSSLVRSGVFTSPNYPQSFPARVDCEWVIMAPRGKQIRLDFIETFQMLDSWCTLDFVEIRDGATTNSLLIGKYCGSTAPGSIHTTSNFMYVRFHGYTGYYSGFKAQYQIAVCGGSITGSSGTIQSPNFPLQYSANLDCEWNIKGLSGHYLTLQFTALNLPENVRNCNTSDYVEIREYNASGNILGQYCGRHIPVIPDTSDNQVYVLFHSNADYSLTGFKLQFNSSADVCGGDFNTPDGTFTSPNFPNQYPHSRVCVWKIRVTPGRRIKLTFNEFRVGGDDNGYCNVDDRVMISNGINDNSYSYIRLCGTTTIPEPVQSSGNTMKVMFFSDGALANGGFSATYTSDESTDCGGILTESSGTFSTPDFHNGTYANNMECEWIISNPSRTDSSIVINFPFFQLENHYNCAWDFLEIRGGDNKDGPLLAVYCGIKTATQIISPYSSMYIKFVSDHVVVLGGFNATYRTSNCGGLLENEGIINSPNYPANYGSKNACVWLLKSSDEGSRLKLEFTSFQLELSTNCTQDNVTVLNGHLSDSPAIGSFCGSTKPTSIFSQGPYLTVIFQSDESGFAQGFQASFSSDSSGCGGTFHTGQGRISSPNYPNHYPDAIECLWDIKLNPGYHLILTFDHRFDLQTSDNCTRDYVQVQEKIGDTFKSFGKFCSYNNPDPIVSHSSNIRVIFHSDNSIHADGFSASWNESCGGTFYEESGVIVSPGYPDTYKNNLYCLYTIVGDPDKYIMIDFDPETFSIEQSYDCIYDSLKIFGGINFSNQIGSFCGSVPPPSLSSKGSINLLFKTDNSVVMSGFRITYRFTECGGNFRGPAGIISSPTTSKPYLPNLNCTYNIIASENQIIELKFTSFSIELSSSCQFDFVEVYDGNNTQGTMLGRLCGHTLPSILRTRTNQMMIVFSTDASAHYSGFQAAYRQTYGELQGCGGLLNSSSGSLQSLDYDNNGFYESDLDCSWVIIGDENKILSFAISEFMLEYNVNCTNDYLSIYDGLSNYEPLIGGPYCGTTFPTNITASTNKLYIRFITDNNIPGKGFKASFTSINALCGGVLTAQTTPQVLTSLGYPNLYPNNLRCRWSIVTPDETSQILIKTTDFQLQEDNTCSKDYMEFRYIKTSFRPIKFCGHALPHDYTTISSSINVNFITDNDIADKGFSLTYEIASCNRNYSNDNGQIYSPSWPKYYPSMSNCTMRITVQPGRNISMYFNMFSIKSSSNCVNNYLEIRNGNSEFAPLIDQYCGSTVPDPVYAGNNIWMRFISDNSVTRRGYFITYTSSPQGCGGNLTGTWGSFTNPGYPGNNSQNALCEWIIQVPVGHIAKLRFRDFNLDNRDECANNYVEVRNGVSQLSPLIGRFCGVSQPANITSSRNSLYVRYVTTTDSIGTGFLATYQN